MLMGALLIHLTGGRIETHFHVFGSLAFLAFYRDWRVLVPATVVVALDHLLRGIFWPQSVYGVLVASEWRWLEHAGLGGVRGRIPGRCRACAARRSCGRSRTARRSCEQAHKDQARHAIELGELVARLRLSQQEVEAATRAKSEFLANMSHELRTPLNAITLYSELLQEDAAEEGRESDVADLAKIQAASKHLLGLINGILDLSKIEAGKMELDLETFDVEADDRRAGQHDRRRGPQERQHADASPSAPTLGAMHADLTKTRQILFNLLSNAAKFTHAGLRLAARRPSASSRARECFEFVVTDTGIGLTEEQKDRLFRPFVQADTSIARKYGGTGLGLALVWRFCQLMGGDVSVESPAGEGATFTVRLPVSVSRAPRARPAARRVN